MTQQALSTGTLSEILRISCEAVYRSTGQVTAVTFSDALRDGDSEIWRLSVLSQRLAEEYGLQSELCFDSGYFTMRFSR